MKDIFYIYDKDKVKVDRDGTYLTAITRQMWCPPSFGKVEILSNIPRKYKWDFTVNAAEHVVIGISSSTQTASWDDMDSWDYCAMGWRSKYHKTPGELPLFDEYDGFTLKDGDKVAMYLDTKERQIGFMINDRDKGIAFNDIMQGDDIIYRFMAQIRGKAGLSIQIDAFEETC